MITRYPILDFLNNKTGTYKADDDEFELELRRNGYDFLLLTKGSSSRSQIYGLIGVAGENLELHASMGFPNIYTFVWPHALEENNAKQAISFEEKDGNILISFVFDGDCIVLKLIIGGQEKVKYVLQRA